jgi:hypothetical protein
MKSPKFSKNNNLGKIICYIIFIVIGIYIIYFLFRNNNMPKINEELHNSGGKFKEYTSHNKYADVVFKANNKVMYVTIKYKNLAGISAIHIHANNKGSPGPILAWLGTTQEWQNGVKQNTLGTNLPCCTKNNPKCLLIAPNGTPFLSKKMEGIEQSFIFYKKCGTSKCKSDCMWIKNGSFLVVHGFKFQQLEDGVLTKGTPGLDVIEFTPFTEQN